MNIDKPLATLRKRKTEKTQINKIRVERGDSAVDTNEIQNITRKHFENLYYN
jgi:hypothetical protein